MDKKIKILLIDDEPEFIQLMAFWLESKGHEAIVAYDGKSGIELVRKENPDIIFLDFNMSIMDGIETLEKIRKFNQKVPVIIISAYMDQKKIGKFKKHGVSGVFYKGEGFEKSLALLELALKRHKKEKK